MRTTHILAAPVLAAIALLGAHAGAEPLFSSAPLSDEELGEARGGFDLANGMKIDFGVMITTRVDGLRVLQTELRLMGDQIRANVLTAIGKAMDKAGSPSATAGPDGEAQAQLGGVAVQADQGGASAQAGASAHAGNVEVGASPAGAHVQIGDLALSVGSGHASVEFPSIKVDAPAGSPAPVPTSAPASTPAVPATQDNGTALGQTMVSIGDAGVLATAQLPDLLVQHAIGREISSLVVNTANGRIVDNEVSINLRLDDVQPFALGSVGYRVQSLGVDAALWRAVGG